MRTSKTLAAVALTGAVVVGSAVPASAHYAKPSRAMRYRQTTPRSVATPPYEVELRRRASQWNWTGKPRTNPTIYWHCNTNNVRVRAFRGCDVIYRKG